MKNSFGTTLVELLVTVAVLLILTGMAIPAFNFFRRESDLSNNAEEIINSLRLAQNKTLASEGESQYGVYFDDTTSPHQYTLFKGIDFASRDISFDEVRKLSKWMEIYEINLGGVNEVVFNRITGLTSQSGNVSLRLKTDITKTRTIYVESSGQVGLTTPSTPTDGRIEDSRHVHFDYSRVIETTTEKLILTFDTTITKEIIIADYLKDNQIYWEEEVDVNGDIQKVKIHTHRLNNPDTQFCVHRDRRYNNKILTITISGDGSGDLISYIAEGQESRGTSIYLAAGETGDPKRQ